MSDKKHTRGPWTLGDENNESAEVCAGPLVISFDRHDRLTGKIVVDREEMLANAHLVMAAPDMLAILTERREWICDGCGYRVDVPQDKCDCEPCAYEQRIWDVIDKARGGS